jgi:hypothetical protein
MSNTLFPQVFVFEVIIGKQTEITLCYVVLA